jgi:adenylate kinase family enzyme
MATKPKIHIRTDERVLFVGKTGSGKTELSKFFLSKMNRCLIIDPKHMFNLEGYEKRKNLPFSNSDFRIIYRPNDNDDETLAKLIQKIAYQGDCTIYCDELSTLAEQFPESVKRLGNMARIGREMNVAVWNSLQRPRWIPRIFLTESEIVFNFNLRSGDDRKYMAEFVGPEALAQLEPYAFLYSNVRDTAPSKMRLDLDKRSIMIL